MNKRLFFSISLPEEIKTKIGYSLEELKTRLDRGVRWVDTENLHITILFLGSVKEEEISKLIKKAKTIEQERFSLRLEDISYFPQKEDAKIIWVNLKGDGIREITEKIKKEVGFLADKKFIPHITLGRIKKWEFKSLMEYGIPDLNINLDIEFDVFSFKLMESKLEKTGPKYFLVKSFNLKNEK